MSVITLPYKFTPRDYQWPAMNAFVGEEFRHFCLLWHRRAGKTKICVNFIVAAAQKRVGSYFYLLPQLKQARRSVWENRGADGIRFIDHFPPGLISKINNTEMLIEFKCGSIVRFLGSDAYDRLMGTNPLGVLYDEYSLQNPYAREYLIPIIAENGGFEIFIYTPRGGNHGYKLYQESKNNPLWFTQALTVNDTTRHDGSRVITEEVIDEFRKSGWSEDKIEQEFYLSFTAAVTGAYFAKQLQLCEQQNRIFDFPYDTSYPVYTFWDLGLRDATAIWWAQFKEDGIYVINYYENKNEPLNHYINVVHDFREKNKIIYAKHVAPHDVQKRDAFTAKTLLTQASEIGFDFFRLPRINNKPRHIELGRSIFSQLKFHLTFTARGLDCLREYHAKYNEIMGVFSVEPEHNWAADGADAFLYMAQYFKDHHKVGGGKILYNAVNRRSPW